MTLGRAIKNGLQPDFSLVVGIDSKFVNFVCSCGTKFRILKGKPFNGDHKYLTCNLCKIRARKLPLEGQRLVFRRIRADAKSSGRIFLIDFEWFCEEITKPCHYCGAVKTNSIKIRGDVNSFKYNGLDRVDNTIGYIKDNCVSCCKICNRAKGALSSEDFINWIKNLYTHTIDKGL